MNGAALECYRSPEYAKTMALRAGKAVIDTAIVEGYDGPQPTDLNKGQSGNPGGRPKMPEDLKRAMQGMAAEALEVLQASLRSEDERMRLEAVKILFDRGYGKPTQAVDLTSKTDLGAAHLDAL